MPPKSVGEIDVVRAWLAIHRQVPCAEKLKAPLGNKAKYDKPQRISAALERRPKIINGYNQKSAEFP